MSNVTLSSIEAYHQHPTKEIQRQAVAVFILAETKAGRWTWITKISDNAHQIGHPGLAQHSTASARLKELKKHGATINGQKYELVKSAVRWKPPGSAVAIEQWAIILKKPTP